MSEYKEFWIQASNRIAHDDKPPIVKPCFHVIEYEAFEKLKKQNEVIIGLLREFIDVNDEECYFDHHGYCQAHFVEQDCVVMRARQALKDVKDVEVWDEC